MFTSSNIKNKKDMAQHTLDWSTAFTGRMENMTKGTHKYSLRTQDLSQRLQQNINKGKLPFITLPYAEKLTEELEAMTPYIRKFSHMVVLGIGGSSLGAKALQKAFFPQQDRPNHKGPWLWVMDNVDSETTDAVLENLDPHETLVVTISKSGGTLETIAQYFLFCKWLQNGLSSANANASPKSEGMSTWHDHLLLITDDNKGFLREEADRYGIRSLSVPDNLGGRYSVLSAVGLVPAVFMGIDWKSLLLGAMDMGRELARGVCNTERQDHQALATHPAWHLALWHASLMDQGYNQLIFFSYAPKWASFGPWFEQLWAESLGKEGKGSMPLPAVGVTDQHSTQQMFLDGPRDKACICVMSGQHAAAHGGKAFPQNLPEQWQLLKGKRFGNLLQAESLGTRMAMHSAAIPLVTLDMADLGPHAAGRFMMLLELMTLFTGWLLDINPLDQPAVELGKQLANAELATIQATHTVDAPKTPHKNAAAEIYSKEQEQLQLFKKRTPHKQEF